MKIIRNLLENVINRVDRILEIVTVIAKKQECPRFYQSHLLEQDNNTQAKVNSDFEKITLKLFDLCSKEMELKGLLKPKESPNFEQFQDFCSITHESIQFIFGGYPQLCLMGSRIPNQKPRKKKE